MNNSKNEILNEESIIGEDLLIQIDKNRDEISRTTLYLLIILLIIIVLSFAASIPITFLTKNQIERTLLTIAEINQKDIKSRLRELKEYYYEIINLLECGANININQGEEINTDWKDGEANFQIINANSSKKITGNEVNANNVDNKEDEFKFEEEEEEEKKLNFRGKRQAFRKFHRNYFGFIIKIVSILILLVGLSLMIYFLINHYLNKISDIQDHFQLINLTHFNSILYLIISSTLFTHEDNPNIANKPLAMYLNSIHDKMLAGESTFEKSFYKISVSDNYRKMSNNYLYDYLCNFMEGKLKEECLNLQLGNLLKGMRLANNQIIDNINYHIAYILKNSSFELIFLNEKAYCEIEFITFTYLRLLYNNLSENSLQEIFSLIKIEKTFLLLILIFSLLIGIILFIGWIVYSFEIRKEVSKSSELINLIPSSIIESNVKLREFTS